MPIRVSLYVDYRSPYSYIVSRDALEVERDFDITLTWYPFAIDLEGAYGGAVEQRTERDWRKIRYLYVDARRMANKRGITVLGPLKIFNPTLAHIGMNLAIAAGREVFERFHFDVCERFWKRELDIEDFPSIRQAAVSAGIKRSSFEEAVASGKGDAQCRSIHQDAEAMGVFGVPTFVLHEPLELFWGVDRVPFLRERLAQLA